MWEVSPFCGFGVCVLFGFGLGQGGFGDAAASIPDEVLVIDFIVIILLVRFLYFEAGRVRQTLTIVSVATAECGHGSGVRP